MNQQLTPERLGRLIRVEPEVRRIASDTLLAAGGSLETFDEPVVDLEEGAAVLAGNDAIRKFLEANEWTPREFLETLSAVVKAFVAMTLRASGQLQESPEGAISSNMELLSNPPAELAASLDNWRRTQMDPALKRLAD